MKYSFIFIFVFVVIVLMLYIRRKAIQLINKLEVGNTIWVWDGNEYHPEKIISIDKENLLVRTKQGTFTISDFERNTVHVN